MELIIKIVIDGVEEKDVKVMTETKKPTEQMNPSQYARIFDDACVGWTKDPEYNLVYLKERQNYANCMLINRGHLFLNEVYDMLGIPRTKAGAVVGWIYDEEHPYGDNFLDFGLYDPKNSEYNSDFINGYSSTALLDFNVDGDILDQI